MKIEELVEKARTRLGVDTDYKLAKALGWHQQKISNYKNGRMADDAEAIALAKAAGLEPKKVLAEMHAERAKSPEIKKLWKEIAAGIAASMILIFISMFALPKPASANNMYIM